jgi:uncharacterized membrane protein
MSKFWQVRISTFIWGLLVVYFFTRKIDVATKLFLTQVIGNTIIMYLILGWKKVKSN